MILTKIQYNKHSSPSEITSGEVPFYEKDGRLYLKSTGEEVTIEKEESYTLEDLQRMFEK